MKAGKPTRAAQRNDRLAAALRENLKRRKARARAIAAPKEAEPPPNATLGESTDKPASGHARATKPV
jgi:hypothetical protein